HLFHHPLQLRRGQRRRGSRQKALRLLLEGGVCLRQLLDETGALSDEASPRLERRLACRAELAQLPVAVEEGIDHEEVQGDEKHRARGGDDDRALTTA